MLHSRMDMERWQKRTTLLRLIPTMTFQDVYLDMYSDILPTIVFDIYSATVWQSNMAGWKVPELTGGF